jgi:hypothetical protein
MTHEYDEEMRKVQGVHPPSTVAGASSKATSSSSPTQLPAWTQGAGSRSPFEPGERLALDPKFVSQMMKEEGRPVRQWLDENAENLRPLSLTLSQLVQRVLDSVPGAAKLPRVQIETIICEWATDHNITIPRIALIPTVSGGTAIRSTGSAFTDSDLISSIKSVVGKIPTEIKVERAHGKAVINASGATVELRPGPTKSIGGSLDWKGKMGVTAASGGLRFKGDLSAKEWNLQVSYTLGPSAPNLADLAKIFDDGVQSLQDTLGEIERTESIPGIKDTVSAHWDKVDKAVKAATQIAQAKAGQVSVSIQAGAQGPTFGGGPQPPVGIEAKALITWTF